MWVLLDRFGRVLVDATLAATVMMSLVVVLLLLCRQPTRRITAARPALLLAVLMLPLVAFSPLPRFHLGSWLPALDDSAARGPTGWWTESWPLRIAGLLYLAMVAIGLVWLMMGIWGIARLVRRSEVPQPSTRAMYEDAIRVCGNPPAPELLVSRRISRPVVASLIHSYIVIPPAFDEPGADPEPLRWMLIHELAHARQNDAHLSVLASLAQTLWFFLPFFHWLRTQIRLDQEFLADQQAVAIAGSPARYANRLVSLARAGGPASPPAGPPEGSTREGWSAAGLFSPLLQRVAMLLRCPYPLEERCPRSWAVFATLFILALGCLSSCLSLSGPDGTAPEPLPSAAGEAPRTFRVDHFLAAPRGVHKSGRSLPYVLPLALPPQFELSVEIQLPREALSRMRLAGLILDQPATAVADLDAQLPAPPASPDWHRVRLRRGPDRIDLVVDDVGSAPDPGSHPLSEWLTIEPPADQTAVLRSLVVTW
jgi:beta-lactamase regulating signal transducer with metallopeptidase domain